MHNRQYVHGLPFLLGDFIIPSQHRRPFPAHQTPIQHRRPFPAHQAASEKGFTIKGEKINLQTIAAKQTNKQTKKKKKKPTKKNNNKTTTTTTTTTNCCISSKRSRRT